MANKREPARRPMIVMTVVLAYDLLCAAVAMFAAILLRYEFSTTASAPTGLAPSATMLFVAACAVVFPLQGLHRGVWRFTAFNDTLKIIYAVILANLAFLLALFVTTRLNGLPRSVIFIEGPLLVFLLAAGRYARQMTASGDWRAFFRFEDRSKPAAVLAGSHAALDTFLRDVARRRNPPAFRISALAEPSGAERGRLIRGAPVVGGPEEAKRALMSLGGSPGRPPQLILVDANLSRDEVNDFAAAATEAGAELVRANPGGDRAELSPLDAADLLSRPPRQLDPASVRDFIGGRRVLVTGAGGTIGAELTRQIARARPAALTLLDSSEFNLYQIDREIAETGLISSWDSVLGDIRDRRRLDEVMSAAQPDIVLHAAALKHVPLMERNPAEAVLTNVGGTVNVAEAARDAGASVFVLISTDKAVRPTNAMGASKRAAEMFVQALDSDSGDGMRAVAVRFGNVLGSAGSVIPLFEEQIRKGGPITITHKDMTRYFMTVQEAAALVLQAAGLGRTAIANGAGAPGAGLFALDMGDPVRIEHLARELCRLRGLVPDVDIEISYIGLRPGEKVHENLFYHDEVVAPTAIEGVWRAEAGFDDLATFRPKLDALLDAAMRRDRDALMAALQALTPDFHPNGQHDADAPGEDEDAEPREDRHSDALATEAAE